MKKIVEKIVEIDYNKIEDFVPIYDERFGLVVNYNNVKYEFIVHIRRNHNKLFAFGSGLIPENQVNVFANRPIFKRHSWDLKPEINVSTIFYNDPTLYYFPNLRGAWGIGIPEDYFLENISKIFSKIFSIYYISNEDVIFYSSSMGGFMSIQLATMMPGSIACPDIPQTDLQNFWMYDELINTIFDGCLPDKLKYRFDCIELMKKKEYIPKIYFIMDIYNNDLNKQFYPFFTRLHDLNKYSTNNTIKILINPVDMHLFLSFNELIMIIDSYFNFDKNNHVLFDKIDFISILEDNNILTLVDIEEEHDDIVILLKNLIKKIGVIEKKSEKI